MWHDPKAMEALIRAEIKAQLVILTGIILGALGAYHV